MTNKADSEIYLTYSESETGGVPDDPNEKWTCHSPLYIDFQPQKLYIQKQSWQETIKVFWDPSQFLNKDIWVVVVRYQSGSSFGTSHGNWNIIGAYTTGEEAQAVSEIIAKYSEKGEGTSLGEAIKPYVSERFYPRWFGYFEQYEGVEIHGMTLLLTKASHFPDDDGEDLNKSIKFIKH